MALQSSKSEFLKSILKDLRWLQNCLSDNQHNQSAKCPSALDLNDIDTDQVKWRPNEGQNDQEIIELDISYRPIVNFKR